MMGNKERLGIYGGTFSPPHIGHVRAALDFLREAELDRLMILPAAIPPHKHIGMDDDPMVRLAMTRAAFAGLDERITVSDYEIAKAGVSYTYETLTHFRETTDADIFLLCGTDMFLTLDTWRCPDVIFSLATVACVMREADDAAKDAVEAKAVEYRTRLGARTLFVRSTPTEISSTEIREHLREGRDVSSWISPAVAKVIRENNLYQK